MNKHDQRMLNALVRVPGYIDDVARYLIALARANGGAASCRYGGVDLLAREHNTVEEISRNFHAEQRRRHPWLHQRSALQPAMG